MIKNKLIKLNCSIITTLTVCLTILSILPIASYAAGNRQANIRVTPGVPMGIAVDLNRDGVISFDKDQPRVDKDGNLAFGAPNNRIKAKDKTLPQVPYRFWLNNDLDVVSNNGIISFSDASCEGKNVVFNSNDEYEQTCEVWDVAPTPGQITNTSPGFVRRIENYRDLEDFSPIDIKIDPTAKMDEFYWKIHTEGITINLFRRYHTEADTLPAHGYIFNTQRTKQQYDFAKGSAGHFKVLKAGNSFRLSKSELDQYFLNDSNGVGRFIFEGITPCKTDISNCYVELSLYNKKGNKPVPGISSKVYLDIHDVTDYYDLVKAGPSAQVAGQKYQLDAQYREGEIEAFHASYDKTQAITTTRSISANIYDGLFAPDEITKNYILQVHGWRVQDSEKTNFSETSYKRLYWSGYKGQMGALHWPTGWFDKPAHIYSTLGVLSYVLGNERNYDLSELVARRVGVNLVPWLNAKKATVGNIHAIAHSMGNVVISEALRNGATLTSYTAGQAAIDAGSYDSASADISHSLRAPGFISCPITAIGSLITGDNIGPEVAWRCYNYDNQLPGIISTSYDMPPDQYRYDFIVRDSLGEPATGNDGGFILRHGSTKASNMTPYPIPTGADAEPGHYFASIGQSARIVNYYNKVDAALTAWEFNQLTKPDFAQGETWGYSNTYLDAMVNYYSNCVDPCTSPPAEPSEVDSSFKRGGTPVLFTQDTAFELMAFVLPARTEPLGQVPTVGEISGNPEMSGFTNSNQDHSAPYHGYYSEVSVRDLESTTKRQQRAAFWNTVLNVSLYPIDKSNLTGLKNGINN